MKLGSGPRGLGPASVQGQAFGGTSARGGIVEPNWYPDPEDGSRWRWWDGQAWTHHRSDGGAGDPPDAAAGAPDFLPPSAPARRRAWVIAAAVLGAAALGAGASTVLRDGQPTAAPVADEPTDESEAPEPSETPSAAAAPTPTKPKTSEAPAAPAAPVLAQPFVSDVTPLYDAIEYEKNDLGFTPASLSAAVLDLGADAPELAWAVTPDGREVCAVEAEFSDVVTAYVGACHAPVPELPTTPGCRAALAWAAADRVTTDPPYLAALANDASGALRDRTLAERITEATEALDRDMNAALYDALTVQLAEATCGQLNRAPVPAPNALDWDGAKYDLGTVTSVGGGRLTYDRWGYYSPEGPQIDGPDLDRLIIDTPLYDNPFSNVNPALREFVITPYTRVMRIANELDLCGIEATGVDIGIRWDIVEPSSVITTSSTRWITALRYDTAGQVVELWAYQGC